MEQSKKFRYKLETFEKALSGFNTALTIDLDKFNKDIRDVLKNGQIQKFEICAELTWKIIKLYLYYTHGIDAKSPKQAMKEFYIIGSVSQAEYEILLDMLDDRNKLSHEYKENYFDDVSNRLNSYLKIMKHVLKQL
jgi:nucleotidyltransferase substrate binding protein (TIGR01987 family)